MTSKENSQTMIIEDPLKWLSPKLLGVNTFDVYGVKRGIINLWLSRHFCLATDDLGMLNMKYDEAIIDNWLILPDVARCMWAQKFKLDLLNQSISGLSNVAIKYMQQNILPPRVHQLGHVNIEALDDMAAQELLLIEPYLSKSLFARLKLIFPVPHRIYAQHDSDGFSDINFFMALQHVQRNGFYKT